MQKLILFLLLITSCCKQKLIITRGLPASGKTTYGFEVAKDSKGYVVVDNDFIRQALYKDKLGISNVSNLNEQELVIVYIASYRLVKMYLKNGISVVQTNTNLREDEVEKWRALAKEMNVTFEIKDLRNVPIKLCKQRNIERYNQIGKLALDIDEKYDKFIKSSNNN